jgi:hypothetical protein
VNQCEARKAWRMLPRSEREGVLLDLLGDDRLLLRELADRINHGLGFNGDG